jgi:tetratricopeptide (TPR) repeat protein
VQYLWITSYYATRSDASQSRLRFLGKAALAGYAVWTVPGLIFAPGLLGSVAYDSGLALLVASFVNLHHFVLDGAVWKLRDGRVGSVLLRSDAPAAPRVAASGRGWIRKAAWTAGVVSIGVSLVGFWESEFGFRRALARGDIERVDTALGRFAAIGRDGPAKWTRVGRYLVDQKDFARASLHLEHSIELAPTHRALHTLGLMRAQQRLWEPAVAAFDRAIELVPDSEQALYGRGLVFLEMGRPADATVDLERVIELHPRHDKARFALGRARAVLRATAKESSAR